MKKIFVAFTLAAVLLATGCASRKAVKTIKIVTCTTDGETISLEDFDCDAFDGHTMNFTYDKDGDSCKTIIMNSLICSDDSGKTYIKITENGEVLFDDSLSIEKIIEDATNGLEITEVDGKKIIVLNKIGDCDLSIPDIKIIKVTVDEETSEIEMEIDGEKYVLPEDLDKLKELDETKQEPEGVEEAEEGPPSD